MIGEIDFVDVSQAIEGGYHYLIPLIDAKDSNLELAIKFDKVANINGKYYVTDEYCSPKKTDDLAINRIIDYVIFEPQAVQNILKYIEYAEGVFFLNGLKIGTCSRGHFFVYEKGVKRSLWGQFEIKANTPFRLFINKKEYESIINRREESKLCDQLEKEGHTLSSLYKQLNSSLFKQINGNEIDYKQLREWQERADKEDGKPTLEQLQAENEALKLRIAELAESQSLATCEISSKSKAPIAATFKAIRALAPDITIDAIESQTQLDGNPVSRSTIANYLNGKI